MPVNYQRALRKVLKLHPELTEFPDDAAQMAREWCEELAREAAEREDTPCIQDYQPAEYFTERGVA